MKNSLFRVQFWIFFIACRSALLICFLYLFVTISIKKLLSKDFRFYDPTFSAFQQEINNVPVFYSKEKKGFICYGEVSYFDNSKLLPEDYTFIIAPK